MHLSNLTLLAILGVICLYNGILGSEFFFLAAGLVLCISILVYTVLSHSKTVWIKILAGIAMLGALIYVILYDLQLILWLLH
jgi:hypothetical protein